MVSLTCDQCNRTYKKKQLERHWQFECTNAYSFSCLDCYQHFDRETLKGHTSCITEVQKYHKLDDRPKRVIAKHEKQDFSKVEWGGLRKTAKSVLLACDNAKTTIDDFIKKLAEVYARSKDVEVDAIDLPQLRKNVLNKIEDNDKFSIDLSRNTVRYKF